MLTSMNTINLIIRRHKTPRGTNLQRQLKRQQVDLTHRAGSHHTIHRHALMLLVITDKVLQRRRHAPILNTLTVVPRKGAREDAILRERLEPAAAKRGALDVDGWAEDDVRAFRDGLVGQ